MMHIIFYRKQEHTHTHTQMHTRIPFCDLDIFAIQHGWKPNGWIQQKIAHSGAATKAIYMRRWYMYNFNDFSIIEKEREKKIKWNK